MKVSIEQIPDDQDEEIILRCHKADERIKLITDALAGHERQALVFYKEDQEFFFPVEKILFFETEGEHIHAHTRSDAFRIKERLYELEKILPRPFVRVSKSAIVNCRQIYSITRNLTSTGLICFPDTHKKLYVSRSYYSALRSRLQEKH